ncbi:nuclear transport factor 2 family protein [Shewanella sp. SR43-4]|uniref:nuclear transport factor 2 family protein n=1 Tax=Shewanella TaxID=22 RepID=UPI0015FCFDF7|nr:nuclear transport factor 2 family protein [Shewanella sp. SR43-4]MBB1318103.1 nuclear transport factor 2 family protein [Shewanella sp. SR43-4]|tara:strand:- start:470 stop:1075 length:606 start_codon:yes stop_codon:yes gene_type:complete
MQSIINRLGFIAVLMTTVAAFDLHATEADDTTLGQSQTEPKNKQVSQQVSSESEAVIKNISQANELIDSQGLSAKDSQAVSALLNQLHESAAAADWTTYFSLYHPQAVFIGTDKSERWDMLEFERYAKPTQGWRYDVKSRHLLQIDDTIVFDEQLYSPEYGISRGTGALVQTVDGWKIAQYHLSFPIPNDKAKRITSLIMQ